MTINNIIEKCLQKEVSLRYQRASDILKDLEICITGTSMQREIADIRKRITIKETYTLKHCFNPLNNLL